MRIISGSLRGHTLRARAGGSLRPTGERMRESLFSALAPVIPGATVLDLFAGTGALGFEALSRGAGQVTFVERKRKLADLLGETADEWDVARRCRVICADAGSWMGGNDAGGYDLVLADPPFSGGWGPEVFDWWAATAAPESVLVLELPAGEDDPGERSGVQPVKTAAFGDSSYRIYQRA